MRLLTGETYKSLYQNSCKSVLSWPKRVGVILCMLLLIFSPSTLNAQPPTITGSTTVCNGDPQPLITFTWNGSGTAPYTFYYTINNAPEQPITTASGTSVTLSVPTNTSGSFIYTLIRAVDANNTTNPGNGATATITVNPPPSISVQPQSATTGIGCSASFSVTASGAAPLSYQWRKNGSNILGATGSTYTVSPVAAADAASYDVVVSNSCGNITSNAATLIVNAALTVGTHNTDAVTACSNYNPAALTVNGTSGGLAPYSYQWLQNGSPVGTNSDTYDPTNLATPGVYNISVRITDACGTQVTTSAKTITIVADPSVSISGGSSFCVGSNPILTANVTNGTGTIGYQWQSSPDGVTWTSISGAILQSYSPSTSAAGTFYYKVLVTVNGSACNNATATQTITVNPTPTATAPGNQTYCNGVATAAIPLTGTPSNVVFDISGGVSIGLANQTGVTSIPSFTPTTGTATISITPRANGCTGTAVTYNVTVNPSLPVSVSISSSDADNIICAGQSVTFTATPNNGGTSPIYQWRINGINTGSPTSSNTFTTNTLTNGQVVSVALTSNATPCATGNPANSNNIATTVNPIPSAPNAGNGGAVCVGGTISLTASTVAGATYAWTGPNSYTSAQQNPTIANATTTMAGTYSVTVTVNECTSPAGTTNVIVNTIPATPAASNNGPVCAGTSINLSTPAVAGASYLWSGPNGYSSTQQNPTIANATTAMAGTYSVTVTVNGCTSAAGTTNVVVTSPVTPSVSIASSATSICSGASVTFTATPTNGGTSPSYQWKRNGTNVGTNSSTFTTTALAQGDVITVVMTATGCVSPLTATSNGITMSVYSGKPANIPNGAISGPTSICPPTSGLVYTVTAVAGAESYVWSLPTGFTITSGAGTNSITVSVSSAAAISNNQPVSVFARNPCGDGNGRTLGVNVNSFAGITAGPDLSVCAGSSIALQGAWSGNTSASTWTAGSGAFSDVTSPTSSYTPSISSGNVTLTITTNDPVGTCPAASDQVVITVNQPPAITVQPVSPGTLCSGSAMNLSVTATGTGLTYQWKKNGTNISGATSSTYAIPSVSTGDAGDYTVVVSGVSPCTPVTSSTATLVVNQVPAITAPPIATQTLCSGSNATFSVTATGTGLTYQWKKGGTDIPGATASTYTINNITTADAATYTVVVTGTAPCGSVTSQNAVLNVNQVVAITAQPTGATLCSGSAANFSVTATGTGLTYKWKKNGTDIPGATSSSYSILSVSASDAGTYTVEVSGAAPCSPVTSQNAVLIVNQAPTIATQPSPQTLCSGSAASFSVTATGTGLMYQWKKDGANISGATSSTYSIPSVATGDAGDYTVEISGVSPCNPVTSLPAKLVVNQVVSITTPPVANQALCAGSTATFSVVATGTGLSYQWKKNGANIGGATSSSYSINNVTTGDAGTYTVEVSGTAPCSPVTSQNSVLTVSDPVVIQVQPASNQTVCSGFPVSFSVSATGTGLTYQWKKDGVDIPGATSASYSIANAATSHSGTYTVVVSGTAPCTPVTSQNAALVVNQDIDITAQPTATQTLCEGTTATISVTATGNIASYVWRKGGIPVSDGGTISGATTATLTIIGVTTADAGSYDVVISGAGGACAQTISNPAVLNINRHSTITLSSSAGTDAQKKCINTVITPITYTVGGGGTSASITAGALPAGVTGSYSIGVFTISGTPTASGTFSYTITTQGPCNNTSVTGTITVDQNSTLSLSSGNATQPVCINTALSNIVYAVGGGATNAIVTGLPTGVSGTYNAGVFTISGTPTVSGTFNYSVTTEGPCVNPTLTGTITVNQVSTINLSSAAGTDGQTKCINNAISPITYAVGGGATGVNLTGNLPNGVTGSYNNGVYTISGTPTSAGSFNYTLTTTGPCSNVSLNGTIKIDDNSTISLSSAAGTNDQTKCINTAITNITYAIGGGATNATVTGLPTGVDASYSNGVLTISGMPTVAGTFNYTVATQGPCNNPTATGKITVGGNSTLTLTSASADQNLCINSVPTNITYAVGGTATGATVTGLPTGMVGSYNNGVFTINGTPTVAGVFNYTVTTTGSCANPSLGGKITVDPAPAGGTLSPSVITACGTPASGTITLSGYSGTIKRWESSTNGGGSWTPITYTSASFNYSNVSQTTIYRAVIESGTCPLAFSTNAVVSVVPPTTPTATSSPAQICVGQTVDLAATSGLQQSWADIDATFNQANPAGWRIKENGVEINFPAQANNASTFPWSETNGPKQPFGGGVIYNNFPRPPLGNDKFAIASGIVNTTMETPIFSTVGMTAATLQFYQALVFAAGASGKIEISTDGGNTYQPTPLVQYNGPLTIGNPSSNWTPLTIDLSNYVGLSNLRIRFTYNGADNSNWALDGLNLQPPGPVVTYNWTLTNPSGVASPYYLNATNQQNVTATPPAAGTYTYQVTTMINGCPGGTNNVTVTVNPLPTVAVSSSTICTGGTATVTATPGAAGTYSYTWTVPAGVTNPGNVSSFTTTVGGTYSVVIRNTTTNCSSASASGIVTVNTVSPGVIAADQTICSGGDPAAFTVSTAATGGGVLSYQWQSNTTGCGGTWTDIPGAILATYDAPAGLTVQTYYRRIVTSTLNGVQCTATSNCITVSINPIMTMGACSKTNTTSYGSSTGSVSAGTITNTVGTVNYSWKNAGGSVVGTTATVNNLPAGTYTLTVSDNCTTLTCQVTILEAALNATIGVNATVCEGDPSPNITFTNPESVPVRITYNINNGTNLTIDVAANSTATVQAPTGSAGTFQYNLVSVAPQAAPGSSNSITGSATIIVKPKPVLTNIYHN